MPPLIWSWVLVMAGFQYLTNLGICKDELRILEEKTTWKKVSSQHAPLPHGSTNYVLSPASTLLTHRTWPHRSTRTTLLRTHWLKSQAAHEFFERSRVATLELCRVVQASMAGLQARFIPELELADVVLTKVTIRYIRNFSINMFKQSRAYFTRNNSAWMWSTAPT